jgi:WD40 repeat protein
MVRSQTDRITGAVQNQIRQAVRPQLRVRNPAGPVTSLALSADGRLLAIVHNSTSLRIWDLQNGIEQARYDSGDRPRAIGISGDGQYIVLGTEGGM